jgi:hypothetical protein
MKKQKLILAMLAFVFATIISCKKKYKDYLFADTSLTGSLDIKQGAEIEKVQNVTFNPDLLIRNKKAKAKLFAKIITVVLEENKPSDNENTIYAKIEEAKDYNYVLITRKGETYTCNLFYENQLYQLRFIGNNVYQLRKIDQTKFKNEGEPRRPTFDHPRALGDGACANTDPADFIDVMVAYTQDARAAAGSTDAMEAEIYLAVDETNMCYLNSNVAQRIRLVHMVEVNYPETGNANTDLDHLQNPTDGVMDNIQTLRDAHSADVVVLITQTLDYCGLGYFMGTVTTSFENDAYCVVLRSCATGYFSFGHEMGHNMGCDHDCAASGNTAGIQHGITFCGATRADSWRTVMAYNDKTCASTPDNAHTSTRLPFFSNPSLTHAGNAMGTTTGTCQADNHQVLNNTALTVANFRCHSSHTTNVWMKDTWNDTGLEPDPATAGEAMWESPYIWIRRAQDATFQHQHEHENPKFGIPNWIYVKLHNGGGAATGHLHLYYANASISLTWPSGWTEIADIPVSIGASTSKIVEQQWATLPGIGHYCMVARWVSASDPMTFPEGADINQNVRQNNNIVWRNLNIVDMTSPDEQNIQADFIADKEATIKITFDDKFPKKSFVPNGILLVSFDDSTAQKIGDNVKGSGFKMSDKNKYEITSEKGATFQFPTLNNNYKGTIKLTLRKTSDTPAGKYYLNIIQTRGSKTIGGVSYQINTDYN